MSVRSVSSFSFVGFVCFSSYVCMMSSISFTSSVSMLLKFLSRSIVGVVGVLLFGSLYMVLNSCICWANVFSFCMCVLCVLCFYCFVCFLCGGVGCCVVWCGNGYIGCGLFFVYGWCWWW